MEVRAPFECANAIPSVPLTRRLPNDAGNSMPVDASMASTRSASSGLSETERPSDANIASTLLTCSSTREARMRARISAPSSASASLLMRWRHASTTVNIDSGSATSPTISPSRALIENCLNKAKDRTPSPAKMLVRHYERIMPRAYAAGNFCHARPVMPAPRRAVRQGMDAQGD